MDEKIITTDSSNFSNGAMMGAMLDKGNHSDALAALLANGGNNNAMWNNPFVYLVWMLFAGQLGGFGGNNSAISDQLQSLQT